MTGSDEAHDHAGGYAHASQARLAPHYFRVARNAIKNGHRDLIIRRAVAVMDVYSYRSAFIGSTLVARSAGTYPARSATHAIASVADTIDTGSTG